MTGRDWPIRVRIARPEDKEAVLGFATNTWNGWDYIPRVWDDWVVPSNGVVLVATVEAPRNGGEALDVDGAALRVGQPIAMTRVAMLSPDEAWIEGIRVEPRVRGKGIATDLQVAELRWIAAHGARVVRYVTGQSNVGSQRLGAHHGLLEIARWRGYGHAGHGHDQAPRTRGAELQFALSRLGKAVANDWARVAADGSYSAAKGLYQYRPWALQELTEGRFRQHVDRGEVVLADGADGWAALIVNPRHIAEGELSVAIAAGDPRPIAGLLAVLGHPEIHLPDPLPPSLLGLPEVLEPHGYMPWDESSIIVERPMDAAHPLPEAEDPQLLIYGDEPRRIAVPPDLRA